MNANRSFSPHFYDVMILGAGAAGLFCAAEAGKRGRSVLVLEHNDRVGKKIAISGGGRCNFTNLHTAPESFISENPRFVHSPLARFSPQDFIARIEQHKINYYEKKLGQLFCTDSSQKIIEMLLQECAWANVEIRLNCVVDRVEKNERFRIRTQNELLECDSLVIATGGLSIRKLGASDFGLQIALQFGLNLVPARPALVPLTFSENDLAQWGSLQGASFEAIVSCGKKSFQEKVLFTHRGLSGPAILQISSYWQEGEPVHVNLFPALNAQELLDQHQKESMQLSTLLNYHLPKRLAQVWSESYAGNKPLKQYSPKERQRIAELLHQWTLAPQGCEGFEKAEATRGGVDTRELSSRTLECKKVPRLYFVGEVMDVTGQLGGYNFQWAWSSAFVAGQSV